MEQNDPARCNLSASPISSSRDGEVGVAPSRFSEAVELPSSSSSVFSVVRPYWCPALCQCKSRFEALGMEKWAGRAAKKQKELVGDVLQPLASAVLH